MWGGIEAGGTKIVCALAEDPARIARRLEIATAAPEATLPAILEFFAGAKLEGLGLAAFGPLGIDPQAEDYGRVGETPKSLWRGFSWMEALGSLGAPLRIETDVNAAAVAEQTLGAGRAMPIVAYVTVGTGIGVGVARAGRALAGARNYEMGHIQPPKHAAMADFPGACPYHGPCIEGLAAGPAIVARWGANLSALEGDHPAHEAEAVHLAHLVAAITLTHAPHRIVFGGGVMKTPRLLARVRAAAEGLNVLPPDPDYLAPAALGDDAGVTGALLLAAR